MGYRSARRPEVANSALDGEKLRRNRLPRSLKHPGGQNPSEQTVKSEQTAWSPGKSECLVSVPTQLGSSLSVPLAEFLGFARLRP
jgi:hypothetical protein